MTHLDTGRELLPKGSSRGDEVCPICSSESNVLSRLDYLDQDAQEIPEVENPFATLEFIGCSRCGFGWASPYVDHARLERYYARAYKYSRSVRNRRRPALQEFQPLDARSVSQILLVRMFQTLSPGQRVLEIGAGYGNTLRAMSQLVPGLKYYAFEVEPDCAEFLRTCMKVQVFPQPFPAAPGQTRFDLVIMSHTLEHFNGRDIPGVLENVRAILSEEGLLLCEVPHCDWRRHESMRASDSPHLSFFSRDSLSLALERAGLAVRFIAGCAEDYPSWWKKVTSENGRQPGAALLSFAKDCARWFPIPKRLARAFYAVLVPDQVGNLFRSPNFDYGDNRTCLRALACSEPRPSGSGF